MFTLKRTTSADIDFRNLVVLLDRDLSIRDGEEHAFYAQYNGIATINHAVVGYLDGHPVACGAFKDYEPSAVEIKRMYVLPEYRNKGLAAQLLGELETWAKECGYVACVLETGKKQPEAIRLYTKSGYSFIPNYGQYAGADNSVCMCKEM